MSGPSAGWLRLVKARPPVGARCRVARTTTAHHAVAGWSCARCGGAERGQVSPFVTLADRMRVICGVGSIDLTGAVAREQRPKCLIEQCCIGCVASDPPSLGQHRLIDGGAYSYTCHAMIMPRSCCACHRVRAAHPLRTHDPPLPVWPACGTSTPGTTKPAGRMTSEGHPDLRVCVERVTGIEPAFSAWEADVLPLNYTRRSRHHT